MPIGGDPATREDDIFWYVTDNSRVTERTGWRPVRSPRDLLTDVVSWVRENRTSWEAGQDERA